MTEVDKAIRYIFVISVILILVAYFAGTQNVLSTFGTQLVAIMNTATGRTSSGQFASYPTGG